MPSRHWRRASRHSSPAEFSESKRIAGRNDKPQDPKAANGYVREDYAIALAKKAGFVLVGSSEINANPKDTKDWVDGVWTLPPTLSQGDKDRATLPRGRRSGQLRAEISQTQIMHVMSSQVLALRVLPRFQDR